MKKYATLADVQRAHCRGWAVKHDPYPLLDGMNSAAVYWTYHRIKRAAVRDLKRGGVVADERIVRVLETDLWHSRRERLKRMRSERRRSRRAGLLPPARSSSRA